VVSRPPGPPRVRRNLKTRGTQSGPFGEKKSTPRHYRRMKLLPRVSNCRLRDAGHPSDAQTKLGRVCTPLAPRLRSPLPRIPRISGRSVCCRAGRAHPRCPEWFCVRHRLSVRARLLNWRERRVTSRLPYAKSYETTVTAGLFSGGAGSHRVALPASVTVVHRSVRGRSCPELQHWRRVAVAPTEMENHPKDSSHQLEANVWTGFRFQSKQP
jgi:hypothetical protein